MQQMLLNFMQNLRADMTQHQPQQQVHPQPLKSTATTPDNVLSESDEYRKKKKKKKKKTFDTLQPESTMGGVINHTVPNAQANATDASALDLALSDHVTQNEVVNHEHSVDGVIRNNAYKYNDDFSNINLNEPPLSDEEDIKAAVVKVGQTLMANNSFYVSPAFPGSATARVNVGSALVYALTGQKTPAKALKDAIDAIV